MSDPAADSAAKADLVKAGALASLGGMAASAFLALLEIVPALTGPLTAVFFAASLLLVGVYVVFFQRALLIFLSRRVLLMCVSFLGITFLTFLIVRSAPGDPVTITMGPGGEGGGGIDSSKLTRDPGEAVRERLHMLIKHSFSAQSTDPDGDPIQLVFTWGDGKAETQTPDFQPGGVGRSADHHYSREGDFEVRVRARDPKGFESEPSEPVVIRIRARTPPPERPSTPKGPSNAAVGDEVAFTSTARTPDGGQASIMMDWGDGTLSPPSDPVESGAVAARDHKFLKSGRFSVRARAVARKGALGPWSEPIDILVTDPSRSFPRPEAPVGAAYAFAGTPVEHSGRAAVSADVEITWGDGTPATIVKPDGSLSFKSTHVFATDGKFRVQARHTGPAGQSEWSGETVVQASVTNRPPSRPSPPAGPSEGGIHTSIPYQYVRWFWDLLRLDLGRSTSENKEVWGMMKERIPRTLFLDIVAFTLIYIIAVPIGIFSSTNRGTLRDRGLTVALFMLYSLPTFWVGTMLIVLVTGFKGLPIYGVECDAPHKHYLAFGSHLFLSLVLAIGAFVGFLAWPKTRQRAFLWSLAVLAGLLLLYFIFPTRENPMTGEHVHVVPWLGLIPERAQDKLWHAFLPVVVLTYPALAGLSRYARSGMLEVVRQDYIRTARAKGLSEQVVIYKHALRNGLIPIITLMATILPTMISGSVIVEFIFSVQGMGLMAYDAVVKRDYSVIMAVTTASAVLTLVGLLISDILYVLVDPRISFESKTNE